ncbi:SET domain-containing protein like [Verticillium longisporum]|uniref:SET domain-containing protein like n=1 Tax=Verticillium longisporum TaxID=100787 RepID=A0A8I3AHJ8_VERLO|nr:SET domain-containing protein like [Verticillium longisporum]
MDHLAELDWGAMGLLSNPVLRVEAFLQDGDALPATNPGPSNMNPVVSKTVDLSGYMSPMVHTPSSHAATMMSEHVPSPTSFSHHPPDHTAHMDQMILRHRTSPPIPVPGSVPLDDYSAAANEFRRKGTGGLRLARPADGPPVQHGPDSQRQMQIANNFPKRAKVQSDSVVFVPQQSSLDKFVTAGPGQPDLGLLSPPPTTTDPSLATLDTATFNRSNLFCRKVTQASRACRAIEVIVQARWIEHFDAHVEVLAITSPALSPTKRRKAALLEACADFGWSEKELRNKMAIWRGYKEIKDAGGWAALVFAGMGLYRFCKYRVGFTPESMARLRALRPRIEVAADTLHPTWRQLLMIVGETAQTQYR